MTTKEYFCEEFLFIISLSLVLLFQHDVHILAAFYHQYSTGLIAYHNNIKLKV